MRTWSELHEILQGILGEDGKVYYTGTASDWDNVSLGTYNDSFFYKMYYYSESSQSGCWHYDESGNVALW